MEYNDTDKLLERDILVLIMTVSGSIIGWYEIIKAVADYV